jgi:multidrug efflux pump subunit AcrA (membrane-fusion protein)
MARAFIFGLTTMVVVGIVYASLAQVAIHVDARGALTTEPRILPVVVPTPLKVAKLNVREQQLVEKGAVLIVAEEEVDQDLERVKSIVAIAQAKGSVEPALLAELQALEARHLRQNRNVIAPISGVVNHINVSGEGQLIGKGTEVLQLIPKGATFVAELAVANKDISRLNVGLPVIVRLDAFPERSHGAINGVVETVPLSLTPSGDPNIPPAYLVVVRLDRQSFVKEHAEYPFRSGMQLEGRVVTRHESMLVNFMHKLFSISDELGG